MVYKTITSITEMMELRELWDTTDPLNHKYKGTVYKTYKLKQNESMTSLDMKRIKFFNRFHKLYVEDLIT